MNPRPQRGRAGKFTARLKKGERKRQLLAKAKELFLALGYQHTTTEKIAQAAGVTEPVLYQHFANKKALFLEALQEIRQTTLERWNAAAKASTDPLEKLHAVVASYLDTTRERPSPLRLMHRALVEMDDPEVAALLRSFYLDSEKLLAQILHDGQRAGIFRSEVDPRVGAWGLICTALGYNLTLPLSIPLLQEEGYVRKAIACLMTGLRG